MRLGEMHPSSSSKPLTRLNTPVYPISAGILMSAGVSNILPDLISHSAVLQAAHYSLSIDMQKRTSMWPWTGAGKTPDVRTAGAN